MHDLFKQALDERRMLKPDFVRRHGFSSCIFPDYIDKAEFFSLAKTTQSGGVGGIIIHHAEYGSSEQILNRDDLSSAWDSIFELSHEDIIVEFPSDCLFIWLPSGEHMFVVFGEASAIDVIVGLSSKEQFMSYVNNSGLTEAGKKFLEDAFKTYSI
jgi:hypothetical protein